MACLSAALLLHGLVLWSDLPRRLIALLVGGLLLGLSVWLARQGMLARRLVLELRHDQRKGRASCFVATSGGEPLRATVRLCFSDGEQLVEAASGNIPMFAALRTACFKQPANSAKEIKVGTYRITAEGDAAALPGELVIHVSHEARAFDLARSGRQVLVPLPSTACEIEIRLLDRAEVIV